MLKIAINLHKKEKEIKREKNIINTKSTNRTRDLIYIRGLLDYHEQKYETAITHFSSILEKHHDAAYMAALASLKLNNRENAEFFLEKYAEHIDNWQESDEKEYAQKRIEYLKLFDDYRLIDALQKARSDIKSYGGKLLGLQKN